MAANKPNPAMELIIEHLKNNRSATYADIKAAAEKKKLTIYPIMFGRAQTLLGIVKAAPRGQGKAAKARRAAKSDPAAPSGRSAKGRRRRTTGTFGGTLESIVAAVKQSEQARARYRTALERVQAILSEALGG